MARLESAGKSFDTAAMLMPNFLAVSVALAVSLSALAAPNKSAEGGKLFHVVSIKFKEGASGDEIKRVETAFAALKEKIPGITSLHWGTNVSPEKRNKGFTHCFVLTFASEKDRDAYLVHPEHRAFGKILGPVMADVMVIDFWSQD